VYFVQVLYSLRYNVGVLYAKGGMSVTLGEKIAACRKQRRLTQEELAIKASVTKAAISNYENSHSAPSNDTLVAIANALLVSTDYLLGRTDNPSPSEPTAPEWATSKDKRDIKRILEDDLPVMFDGMPVDEEDKQRITDLITGFLWDAKEKNKATYGRKKKGETDQGDNEVK